MRLLQRSLLVCGLLSSIGNVLAAPRPEAVPSDLTSEKRDPLNNEISFDISGFPMLKGYIKLLPTQGMILSCYLLPSLSHWLKHLENMEGPFVGTQSWKNVLLYGNLTNLEPAGDVDTLTYQEVVAVIRGLRTSLELRKTQREFSFHVENALGAVTAEGFIVRAERAPTKAELSFINEIKEEVVCPKGVVTTRWERPAKDLKAREVEIQGEDTAPSSTPNGLPAPNGLTETQHMPTLVPLKELKLEAHVKPLEAYAPRIQVMNMMYWLKFKLGKAPTWGQMEHDVISSNYWVDARIFQTEDMRNEFTNYQAHEVIRALWAAADEKRWRTLGQYQTFEFEVKDLTGDITFAKGWVKRKGDVGPEYKTGEIAPQGLTAPEGWQDLPFGDDGMDRSGVVPMQIS